MKNKKYVINIKKCQEVLIKHNFSTTFDLDHPVIENLSIKFIVKNLSNVNYNRLKDLEVHFKNKFPDQFDSFLISESFFSYGDKYILILFKQQ